MIEYNYDDRGAVLFSEQKDKETLVSGIITSKEDIDELIGRGINIYPYAEPVKTVDDIRSDRDLLLAKNVDIYNPLRWDELSNDQKTKVKAYRQALLDITKQDPTSVTWPKLPIL